VPHITLKSIANNEQIDDIWQQFQDKLEPLREQLNQALKTQWQEWEIPRAASAQARQNRLQPLNPLTGARPVRRRPLP